MRASMAACSANTRAAEPTAWHNLQDVSVVEAVGWQGPPATWTAGQRRRACATTGGLSPPASPGQMRRFAEAKARKMPWTDERTTRFVVYGEDHAMAADPKAAARPEQGIFLQSSGLGVPAPAEPEAADPLPSP
eukprot:6490249-Amphidinium_carterae.1